MIKNRFQQVRTKKQLFFKDELGGKVMKEFVGVRVKTWAYLMDDDTEHNKAKDVIKMCNKKNTYA